MISNSHQHYHLARMSTNGRVVWAHTLATIASAMIMIFVPIFLLRAGYPLPEVLTYLMLQGLMSVPLQLLVAPQIARFGANMVMAVSLVVQLVFVLMLMTLSTVHWPLALLALVWAVNRAGYWVSFHINFSKSRSHKKSGRQIGAVNVVKIISGGLAPAVGGILASRLGISWTYGLAGGLFLAAALIMLRNTDLTTHRKPSLTLLDMKKIRPDLYASVGNSITSVGESITWPILVSLIVPSYAGIGLLSSVVILASIAAAYYVGRREESRGPKHFLRQGSLLAGASDAFRLVAQNAGHIFGINVFWGVGTALYYTPFVTRYYEHADEEPRIEYLTVMEMAHELAWATFFFILLILSSFLPEKTVLLSGIAIAIPANYFIGKIR